MKLTLVCTQFTLFFYVVGAFHVLPSRYQPVGEVSLSMTREMNEETGLSRRNFASAFVAMATSGSFLLGRPQEASAYESSLILADAVKTLDFSLPSYDAISSSKASVETVQGLAETYATPAAPRGLPKKSKPEPKENSGKSPLAAVLPSMNKSNTKKPKEGEKSTAKESNRKKDEEARVTVETMDLSLPSYSAGAGREKSVFSL